MDKKKAYDALVALAKAGRIDAMTFKFKRRGAIRESEYTCSDIIYDPNADKVIVNWSVNGEHHEPSYLRDFVDWFVISLYNEVMKTRLIDRNLF